MKAEKEKRGNIKKTADKKVNPFKKLADDKRRITKAIDDGHDLSTIENIEFVRPL
ncbi:hypothetical protein [Sphingobacterium psychroaquaticum]|uniref:Uncharacterized protein n=1 Tax=Sphingobacterium psychroaquaticum TaxID=561061 RepID=A0A1X7KSV0_9SPHI|nr:hypothetical protein [Sphingobacterium psychroaquaticum]SMG43952.1 hypothetical protein SAMN05660862_3146 [Sphingobacterium psychroaquaticum]